jgi:hypothetical protein
MPIAGFETAIPANKWQTYALDRTATGTGRKKCTFNIHMKIGIFNGTAARI